MRTRSQPISPNGFQSLETAPRQTRRRQPARAAAPPSDASKPKTEESKVNKRAPKKQGRKKTGSSKRRAAPPNKEDKNEPPEEQKPVLSETENVPPPAQPASQSEPPNPSSPTPQPCPTVSSAVPDEHGVFSSVPLSESTEWPEPTNTSSPAPNAASSTLMGGPSIPSSRFSFPDENSRFSSVFPSASAPDRRRSYPPAFAPTLAAQARRMSFHAQTNAPNTPNLAPYTPNSSVGSNRPRVFAQPRPRRPSSRTSGVTQNSPFNSQPDSTTSEMLQQSSSINLRSHQSPQNSFSFDRQPSGTSTPQPLPLDSNDSPSCPCCKEALVCPNSHVFLRTPPDYFPQFTRNLDPLIYDTPPSLVRKRSRQSLDESDAAEESRSPKRRSVVPPNVARHRLREALPYSERRSRRLIQNKGRIDKTLFPLNDLRKRYLNENNKENADELTATVVIQPSEISVPTPAPQPPQPAETSPILSTEPTGSSPTETPIIEPPGIEQPQAPVSRWNIRGLLSAVPQTLSRVFPRRQNRAATTAAEVVQQHVPATITGQTEPRVTEVRPTEAHTAETRATETAPNEGGAIEARAAQTGPMESRSTETSSIETEPILTPLAEDRPVVTSSTERNLTYSLWPPPFRRLPYSELSRAANERAAAERAEAERAEAERAEATCAEPIPDTASTTSTANEAQVASSAPTTATASGEPASNAAASTPTANKTKRRKRKRNSPDVIPNPPGCSYGMDLRYFCYSSEDEDEDDEDEEESGGGSAPGAENEPSTTPAPFHNRDIPRNEASIHATAPRSAPPKKRVRFALSPENTPSKLRSQTLTDGRGHQALGGPTARGALMSSPTPIAAPRSSQPYLEGYHASSSAIRQAPGLSEQPSSQLPGFGVRPSPSAARAETRQFPLYLSRQRALAQAQLTGRWPSTTSSHLSQRPDFSQAPVTGRRPSTTPSYLSQRPEFSQAQVTGSRPSTAPSYLSERPEFSQAQVTGSWPSTAPSYLSQRPDFAEAQVTGHWPSTAPSNLSQQPEFSQAQVTGSWPSTTPSSFGQDQPSAPMRSAATAETTSLGPAQASSLAPRTPVAQSSRPNSTGTVQPINGQREETQEQREFEELLQLRLRQAREYEAYVENHSPIASPRSDEEEPEPLPRSATGTFELRLEDVMVDSDEEREHDEHLNSLPQHQRDILLRWERANTAFERLYRLQQRRERLQQQRQQRAQVAAAPLFQWPQPAALAGVPAAGALPDFGGVVSPS